MSLLEKAARSDCKILKKPKELKTIFFAKSAKRVKDL
jgi:hypothetical protein